MATNGQVKTNISYDSYFWVEWEQIGNQDTANNRTQIKWTCGLYSEHKFYSKAVKMSAFSINGTQVFGGGTYSNFTAEGNQPIASGTLWIGHNADGKKTFSISAFTGWLYKDHNYSCSGGSFALTDIPRKATIAAVSDFTDLDSPSITFSNPGGFIMDAWLETIPTGDRLCVRESIPNTGSYKWSFTVEEVEALRYHCTGTKCTIRIVLYSYVGQQKYSDYRDKTFTIIESADTKPDVDIDINLVNGSIPNAFDNMAIQGVTKVEVTLEADGKYGSGINSYSSQIDGKTYHSGWFISDVLQTAGKMDVIGYAKDSRGFTGSVLRQIDVFAYVKPLVIPLGSENAILCYRSDGNGNRISNSTSVWVKAKTSYYGLGGKNTCSLQWRSKLVSEDWSDIHLWNDLFPASNTTDEYDALIPDAVFDPKKSYTVQLRAIDYIGEQDIKTFEIPTQDVALHLGKGGKNVSIGTYCDYSDDYTFYSEWKAIFGGGVVIGDKTLKEYIKDVINGGG